MGGRVQVPASLRRRRVTVFVLLAACTGREPLDPSGGVTSQDAETSSTGSGTLDESSTGSSTSGGASDCLSATEPALLVTLASEHDEGETESVFRKDLPCLVMTEDVSELVMTCTASDSVRMVSITSSLGWRGERREGDIVYLSYSRSAGDAIADAWQWFSLTNIQEELLMAGGSGSTGLVDDPFGPLVVEYVDDACDEPAGADSPCAPYVRGAVRLVIADQERLVLDRTPAVLGPWSIRAGEIIVPIDAASCGGASQGRHAQWLIELTE